jgi:cytochrome c oxidase subunit 2
MPERAGVAKALRVTGRLVLGSSFAALCVLVSPLAFAAAPAGVTTPPTPGALPMSYWSSAGLEADESNGLLWGLIWLSVAVVAIITVLVIAGIVVRGARGRQMRTTPVSRSGNGTPLIYIGVGISTLVLVVYTGWTVATMANISTGWTVATMANISAPPKAPAFTIAVTGHQWWWAFRYDNPPGGETFTTANEIHIPVGVPVHLALTTADVIHSFWVPALGGKTDLIPGRTNDMWLEADRPGIYRGQCSEYCGVQHAQMALRVIADTPADFAAWLRDQAADAPTPATDRDRSGLAGFEQRCGACHALRGTAAGGIVGPDLSHLMSRTTLAAGMIANTPANLGGWIADPQHIKPGCKMPNLPLSGAELDAITAYLTTLH